MKNNIQYDGKVLICKSKSVYPHYVHGEKYGYFHIEDLRPKRIMTCDVLNEGIKELAKDLKNGLHVSVPITEDSLVFVPRVSSEVFYIDGYFGRPAIAGSVNVYSPLRGKEAKELKQLLFGGTG